jgi:hypothetical protein
MALPPLVAIDDLEPWLGRALSGDDLARAEAVLSAVSALIRAETGRTWTTDNTTLAEVPGDVQAIVLQVAQRVFENPNGARQMSLGSYSISYGASTGLYLDAAERAMLARYRTAARGLWSLSVTRDDPIADTVWVPVEGAEYPFPWYGDDVTL